MPDRRRIALCLFSASLLLLSACFGSKSPAPPSVPTSAGVLSGIVTSTASPTLVPCPSPSATPTGTATGTGTPTATATTTASATPSATATGTTGEASPTASAPAIPTLAPIQCATSTPATAARTGSATPAGSATGTAAAGAAGTASAGAAQTPAASGGSGAGTYTVKAGDTIGSIAASVGVSQQDLLSANNLSNPDLITVGQVLKIPTGASATGTPRAAAPAAATSATPVGGGAATSATPAGAAAGSRTYTVLAGDTACKIAASEKVSVADLASANGTSVSALTVITPGQVLKIPATSSASTGC
jgi:LysM repeat protein